MFYAYAISFIISFVIGSIPFGLLISKKQGINIRKTGSGNIGATNVYRNLGKGAGALTLICDLSKGFLAVFIVSLLFKNNDIAIYISCISVVLGHDFSLLLKFKGGKGVATTYGSTLFLYPYASLFGIVVWIAVLIWTKYSSLAALASFSFSTLICFLFCSNNNLKFVFGFLLILMFIRHSGNIKRFMLKEEKRINF